MKKLTPLVVSSKLRELLSTYPEYIDRLQAILDGFAVPRVSLQPFEYALWLLEDSLNEFLREASEDLRCARESGDVDAVARAEEKRHWMLLAFSRGSRVQADLIDDLWNYFEVNKEAFEPSSSLWRRLGL